MKASELLRDLREAGLEVEADGSVLRVRGPPRTVEAARTRLTLHKQEILAALRREGIEPLLDLVPIDPETGLPDLPADEPATARQVDRLRELADHPALIRDAPEDEEEAASAADRPTAREVVDRAIDRGLSQLGAYALLGAMGRRIERRDVFHCPGCGRRVGPTSERCARCRRGEGEA